MAHFRTLVLTGLILIWPLALGQAPGGERTTTQLRAVGKQVSKLDQQWADAVRLGHADYLNQLFAEDFVEMHSGGEVLSKQKQLDQINLGQQHIKGIQLDKIQVLYASPTVAILGDTTTINSSPSGRDSVSKYQTLRVFVKQQGRWRAAGAVLTELADQEATKD